MFSAARWRLSLWFAGTLALILVIIGVAVYGTAHRVLFAQVNQDLEARAGRAELLPPRILAGERARDIVGPAFTVGGYSYALVRADGTIVYNTENVDPDALADTHDVLLAITDGPRFVDTTSTEDDNLRIYLHPVSARNQQLVLEVSRSTEPERQALERLILILIGGGGAGLLLAAAGGFVLSGRALRPIQTAMDRQREFVADASHELRTPLSLIRANAELLKRGAAKPVEANMASVDDIIQETDRLNKLVGQMLALARADASQTPSEMARVDLNALAADTAREMRLLAAPKRISIDVQTDGPTTVQGDPMRLRELLTILIDNSIKYSESGGAVRVHVQPASGRALVRVTDSGRGIPAEALPHIFDRFYRADKARSRELGGSGLGLAIAKWIVDSHHGTIGIESSPGRGTAVSVELPAVTPEP